MDGAEYQEDIAGELRARRAAAAVLGVGEGASLSQIKRAWRKRCLETHPDRNADDPDAEKRFHLVNCAYRFLTEGTPCRELPTHNAGREETPRHGKYDISNAWGFYLWWKEKFF